MAKYRTTSHKSDTLLSRTVDGLTHGLTGFGVKAVDAPAPSRHGAPTGAAEEPGPIQRIGDRNRPVTRFSSTVHPSRWQTRLRRWAWVRVILGLMLGLAVLQWPYERSCGMPLVAYLGVLAFIVTVASWAGVHAWKTRLATAHVLSLALLAWGAVLTAGEVLPRTNYARSQAAWVCPPHASSAIDR